MVFRASLKAKWACASSGEVVLEKCLHKPQMAGFLAIEFSSLMPQWVEGRQKAWMGKKPHPWCSAPEGKHRQRTTGRHTWLSWSCLPLKSGSLSVREVDITCPRQCVQLKPGETCGPTVEIFPCQVSLGSLYLLLKVGKHFTFFKGTSEFFHNILFCFSTLEGAS